MELASNGDLLNLLHKRTKLPEDEARAIFKSIMDGVLHCHRKGECHVFAASVPGCSVFIFIWPGRVQPRAGFAILRTRLDRGKKLVQTFICRAVIICNASLHWFIVYFIRKFRRYIDMSFSFSFLSLISKKRRTKKFLDRMSYLFCHFHTIKLERVDILLKSPEVFYCIWQSNSSLLSDRFSGCHLNFLYLVSWQKCCSFISFY